MDITEIENALNDLITKADESGGCIWIVDKQQNRFAFRVNEPVKLRAFIPSNNEREAE
jgi:hypothetical protein